MIPAELFKTDPYKVAKAAGIKSMKKYYSKEDDIHFWYNRYLYALLDNKMNPDFNNVDLITNKALFFKLHKETGANYWIEKITEAYQTGAISKIFFNPIRYASDVSATQTGKTGTDLVIEAIKTTGTQVKETSSAAVEVASDTFSMLKNLLPVIIIVIVYMLYQTYMPKVK